MPNLPLGNLVNSRRRSRVPNYVSGRRPISPPYTTNLLGWYKADVGVLKTGGAAANDGDAINAVNDQSGNGYNLGVAAGTPVFTKNVSNGLPGMSFDGSSLLSNASILGVGNWGGSVGTEIVCCLPLTNNYFVAKTGAPTDDNWRYSVDGKGYFGELRTARISGYPTSVPYGVHITFVIVSGTNYYVRVNGTQAANQTTSWGLGATLYLGGVSGSNTLIGYIFEFMLFNAELTTAQIVQNEAYLNSKWYI